MTDVMESICSSFSDYAQAHLKTTGELSVIPIVGKDGKMNPRFSEYDMVQDPDLNKGLEFHCQSIIEDFEEEILKYFSNIAVKDVSISQESLCSKITSVCPVTKSELWPNIHKAHNDINSVTF